MIYKLDILDLIKRSVRHTSEASESPHIKGIQLTTVITVPTEVSCWR